MCIIDPAPRTFTYFDLELLGVLGRRVLAALEQRERAHDADIPLSSFQYLDYFDRDVGVVETARAMEHRRPATLVAIEVAPQALVETARALEAARPTSLVGRLGLTRLGWRVDDVDEAQAEQLVRERVGERGVAATLALAPYAGAFAAALLAVEVALESALERRPDSRATS